MKKYEPNFYLNGMIVRKQRLKCLMCGDDFMEVRKNDKIGRIHPDGRIVGKCTKFFIALEGL